MGEISADTGKEINKKIKILFGLQRVENTLCDTECCTNYYNIAIELKINIAAILGHQRIIISTI